jgi:hypothetical protein
MSAVYAIGTAKKGATAEVSHFGRYLLVAMVLHLLGSIGSVGALAILTVES